MMKHYKFHYFLLLLGVFYSTSSFAKVKFEDGKFLSNGSTKVLSVLDPTLQTVVSGRVTDENGEGLPGVTIRLKGAETVGTVTDFEGNYRLSIPSGQEGGTLVYSFVGYLAEERPINNRSQINVELVPDIQSLDEIVVVGYGTQKKSDLTGSVTSVTSEEFNPGQITTPDQLITGKVAGVSITSNGGAPGSGAQIRIRGGSSLNASNDPLIVIDGVPIDNTRVAGASNPLSFINPNDIESMNILKDASATAIYGSRASNGVIIVTTKKGKAGQKLSVNFNTQHSLSTVPNMIDALSASEFRRVVEEEAPEQQVLLGNANTDWQDLIYRNAYTMDHNLSVSGAYKILPYRLSVGYLDQEGVLLTSHLKRTSGSLNLSPSLLDDHLRVNLSLKGSIANSRFANQDAIGAAVAMDPTQAVYAEGSPYGGYFEWEREGVPNDRSPRNPLSMLEQRRNQGEVMRSIGNLTLDYRFHFLPELKANLNLGYDISDTEGEDLQPATMGAVYVAGGNVVQYTQNRNNKLLDFYLNYVKDIEAIDSKIDVTGGYSYQSFSLENPGYPTLTLEEVPDTLTNPISLKVENVLISFFGRLNYTLKDKYLFTATVRQDGSSRFAPENRWGIFPAFAFAWRIDQENFLANVETVSSLKLRIGYGITGQQDLGPGISVNDPTTDDYYPFLPRYLISDNTSRYPFGDTYYNTYRPGGYDLNIKWEETETYNAGIDFGFLENRISGSVDYYLRKTNDLLANVPVATGTNLTNRIRTNVGSIENEGIEAALNFNIINSEKVSWDVGINGTHNVNKITSLSNIQDTTSVGIPVGGIAGATGRTIQVHTVGYPAYSFYALKQVYDENGNPVEGLYADLDGDGSVSENELYRYQDPAPTAYFGFNSTLRYGNWDLGLVLRASVGNYVYNNVNSNNAAYQILTTDQYLSNIVSSVRDTDFINYQRQSDYYIENASFLRFENLNLGYTFNSLFNDKVNVRLNANVQNAFVITNYSGLDPEISGGIDNNFYPRPRVYTVGLNVGF